VEAEQASGHRRVFTAIRLRHVLTGFGIDKTAVEQAIQLSEEKYCSVGAMAEHKTRHLKRCTRFTRNPRVWLQSTPNPGAGLRLRQAMNRGWISNSAGMFVCAAILFVAVAPLARAQEKGAAPNAHVRAGGAYGAATESGVSNERRRSRGNASKAEQVQSAWYPRFDFHQDFTRGNNPVYDVGTKLTQPAIFGGDFALKQPKTLQPRLDTLSNKVRWAVEAVRFGTNLVSPAQCETPGDRRRFRDGAGEAGFNSRDRKNYYAQCWS